MVSRVTKENLAALRTLEVEVRGVLPCESDSTVDLDVLSGCVEIRV